MEAKRVELMPVAPATQPKKDKKVLPTFRFNLTLTESTDKTCPEFSYTELMKNALGKEEEDDLSVDPLDPFSKQDRQEEDKLTALAKSFEEKYGCGIKPSAKRKRRDHPGDLVDLGEGYDLEDPFIDNTEAYDEVVPSNMTTHLGGFYINSGALDFKYCSDDSDADFAAPQKKKKKVVVISDSESEGGEKKKKKKILEGGSVLKKKLKKSLSTDSENSEKLIKKKKKLVSSEKIKLAKLKKNRPSMYWKQQQTQMTSDKADPSGDGGDGKTVVAMVNGEGPASSVNSKPPSQESLVSSEQTGESDTQGRSTPAKQVTISVVENIDSDQPPKTAAVQPSDSKPVLDLAEAEEESASTSQTASKPKLETVVTLPDTLSLKTLSNIEKLKQAAKEKGTESGKSKFFSQDVNDMLLSIEKDTRQSNLSERSVVYSHLAGHLPCSKETLLKRGKKLLQEQQDDKLREPINKLKEAVIASMPALHDKHAAECAAAQSKQQLKQNKVEKKEGVGSSESEEEGSNDGSEKPKRFIMPRKKFEWTPHLRQLLCSIVVIKMEHYEMSKVRAQSPEEYLKAFLDAEIKPLWPQGWIQTRMLFKESRSVHSKWTNPQSKPKKMVVPLKNTPNTLPALAKTNVSQNLGQSVNSLSKPSPNQTVSQGSSSVTKPEDRAVVHSATNHQSGLYASPDLQNKLESKPPKVVVTKMDSSVPTLLDYAEKGSYPVKTKSTAVEQNSSQKVSGQKESNINLANAATTAGVALVKAVDTAISSAKPVQTNSGNSAKKQSGSRPLTPSNTPSATEKSTQDFLQKFKEFTSTFSQQQVSAYPVHQTPGQSSVGTLSSSPKLKSVSASSVDPSLQLKASLPKAQVIGSSASKTNQYSVKPVSSSSLLASVPKPTHTQRGASSNKLSSGASEASPNTSTSRQPKGPVISTIPLQLLSSAPSVAATTVQLSKASGFAKSTAQAGKTTADTSVKVVSNKVTIPVSTIKVVTTADGKTIRIANPIKTTDAVSSLRQGELLKPDLTGVKTGNVLKPSGKPATLVTNQVKGTAHPSLASSGSTSVGGMNQKGTPQVTKATNQGLGVEMLTSSLQHQQQSHQKAQISPNRQQNTVTKSQSAQHQQTLKQQYPVNPLKATNMAKLPKPSAVHPSKSPVPPSSTNSKPQTTSPKQQHPSPQVSKPHSPKSTFGGLSLEELQRQMLQKDYNTQPRSQVHQSAAAQSAFNSLSNSHPYGSPSNAAAAAFTSMLNRISQGPDPTTSSSGQHTSPSNATDRFQQGSGYGQPTQSSPHTSPSTGRSNKGLFPAHNSPSPTRPAFTPYGYGYSNTDPNQQKYRY